MDAKTKRAKRTAAEWQHILDEQKRSGLSQEKFCRQHQIGYSSFQSWKAKLTTDTSSRRNDSMDFIELPLTATATSNWDIELDLGYGVVLRLRRPS